MKILIKNCKFLSFFHEKIDKISIFSSIFMKNDEKIAIFYKIDQHVVFDEKTTKKSSFLTIFLTPRRDPPSGGVKKGSKTAKKGGFWALRRGVGFGSKNDPFSRRYGQGEPGRSNLSPPFLGEGEKPEILFWHSKQFFAKNRISLS